jgi:large subunit ribosomal protein L15
MQLHEIKRRTPNTASVQVGRGGKRGKTAGRGTKGQKARSGHKMRPEIRDTIKKLPKLRGRGKNSFKSFAPKPVVVNLKAIEAAFANGDTVTPQTLVEKGLIRIRKGKAVSVKILSAGELSKKITVSGCAVSGSASEKIKAAGGSHE